MVAKKKVQAPKPVDETALSVRVNHVTVSANVLTVKSQEDYETAATMLQTYKEGKAQILDLIDGGVLDGLNALRQIILDRKTKYIKPIEAAEATVKRKMSDYEVEQEEEREREAARLRAEAEAEAKKQAASLKRQATRALNKGDEAKAAELQDRADSVTVTPMVPDKAVEKAGTGVASRDDVEYTVTDLAEFMKFVVTKTQYDLTKLLTMKVSGVKDIIKEYVTEDLPKIPGLNHRKSKVIQTTAVRNEAE